MGRKLVCGKETDGVSEGVLLSPSCVGGMGRVRARRGVGVMFGIDGASKGVGSESITAPTLLEGEESVSITRPLDWEALRRGSSEAEGQIWPEDTKTEWGRVFTDSETPS